jgi:hypothetical protein
MPRPAEGRRSAGQATVELIAALPALGLAAFLAVELLLVGYSLVIADGAAEAGALAGARGSDAGRAAREALPQWARGRSKVSTDGGRVLVEVSPPAPWTALSRALTVGSEAWSRQPRGGGG